MMREIPLKIELKILNTYLKYTESKDENDLTVFQNIDYLTWISYIMALEKLFMLEQNFITHPETKTKESEFKITNFGRQRIKEIEAQMERENEIYKHTIKAANYSKTSLILIIIGIFISIIIAILQKC